MKREFRWVPFQVLLFYELFSPFYVHYYVTLGQNEMVFFWGKNRHSSSQKSHR